MSLSPAVILVAGGGQDAGNLGLGGGAMRGGRDRVIGLELDHRPHPQAERGGRALGELELREQIRGDALAGLVVSEQVVAERLDHVVVRDAGVRDRSGAEQGGEASQHHAYGADLAPPVLHLRRPEPRTEQLVRPVEQMDLHRGQSTRTGANRGTTRACRRPAPAPCSPAACSRAGPPRGTARP